jgi:hypothetical protein
MDSLRAFAIVLSGFLTLVLLMAAAIVVTHAVRSYLAHRRIMRACEVDREDRRLHAELLEARREESRDSPR